MPNIAQGYLFVLKLVYHPDARKHTHTHTHTRPIANVFGKKQ